MNTYSNIVRFIVKEGNETKFLEVFDTFVSQEGENYSMLAYTYGWRFAFKGWGIGIAAIFYPCMIISSN